MKGRAIIKGVLLRSGIGAKDFFGPSRFRHMSQARRTAAVELSQAGLSKSAIARLIKRDEKTVRYHLGKAEARA